MKKITENTFVSREGAIKNDETKEKEPMTLKRKAMIIGKILGIHFFLLLLFCIALFMVVFFVRLALTI